MTTKMCPTATPTLTGSCGYGARQRSLPSSPVVSLSPCPAPRLKKEKQWRKWQEEDEAAHIRAYNEATLAREAGVAE